MLFTHHFRQVDEEIGALMGAISDLQVRRVEALIRAAGEPFTYSSFPNMPHSSTLNHPEQYVSTVLAYLHTPPTNPPAGLSLKSGPVT